MTDLIPAAVEALRRKVPSFTAGTAKFVMPGHGAIMVGPGGVYAGDEAAEVTLTASSEVFQGILEGQINPTMAFMTGKLTIEGSMSLALQLGSELG